MDIYTLGILVSLLVYVVVGNYAGRKVKGLDDYFVAGRAAPTALIVGTLVASLMSTNTFLGDAAKSYEGYAGMWILAPATHAVGVAIGAMWFGRYLRRSECLTVAEFLRRCYDSPRIQILAGLTVIFGIGGYLLAVTQGAALILEETSGLSYTMSLIIAWLGYTLFTFYAGSRGVVLTDTIMFVLFVVFAVLGLGYIVDGAGGMQAAITDVAQLDSKKDMLSIEGMTGPGADWATPMESLIWIHTINLAWGFVYIISPHQAGRHLMAKSEHVVIRAGVIATIFITIIQLAIWTAAAIINVYDADITPSSDAILWAAMNAMPPIVGSIMLAGLMAAALSSASTFLSLTGFSVSYDIAPEKKNGRKDDA